MVWLYNNDGEISLTDHFHDKIPRYAILSHTWGPAAEEVTFEDIKGGIAEGKQGYAKIRFCGERARQDGIQYFWVDTCCIDKSNNAELAEAITSMFRWYQNAAKCYVYLSDVWTDNQVSLSLESLQLALQKSRWFTRGWTLQELIAPQSVEFFCSNCNPLGSKRSLEQPLHEITGIAVSALRGDKLSLFEVEERMSWAERRDTTREEDKAYSMLGIFDVSMAPIYGEGVENAFERLHDELLRREKKRAHDQLSAVLQPNFDSRKRLMTRRSESHAISSSCDPSHLNPQPRLYSKDSIHSIDAGTKQSLIDQLYFDKIDERVTSLTAAQGTTCRWFFTKSVYTSWYNVGQQPEHSGFLWIKGNPGTGKSTLMKLLFETAKLKGDSSQLTLSFFFLARGIAEEKSTTGLYRSLLHQLFQKVEELRDSLDWMTPDGARSIQRNQWHDAALKQTLAHAVQKLGSRSLMIFVDALDECNQGQAADMVCFFEELCGLAREAQVSLRICFSSRHYPTITIQKGVEVTLEDEAGHTEDMEQYIRLKLRLGTVKQAEPLRADILKRSSGIFLWVVLVIDILNGEYQRGLISPKQSRQRLKEIPPELSKLFEMIITRDGENPEQLQLCLRWVLFAARPLKPQELYFAIQLGLNKSYSSCWDQEDIDLDQMKSYVRSSSKGLAEVTRNKASEVQFIHESVRDYLLARKFSSQLPSSTMETL
ncbi:heterokaryon incompatibility protein-domain-containing protein [Tricladium varicosporioides]|nr:heterokaryon incompatibility protein-domain-containing protein [Hymenoscyphus varicosporioides]